MSNAGQPFRWPIRIYYDDTDATGVVYHARYLVYFERARTEWLRHLGFGQEWLRVKQKIAFTLASAELRYRKPARLDDNLNVRTRVSDAKRASLVFEQGLYRDDTELASGRFRVGCVAADTFRPTAIPTEIREVLA